MTAPSAEAGVGGAPKRKRGRPRTHADVRPQLELTSLVNADPAAGVQDGASRAVRNRASAARSRQRKDAYITELEASLTSLQDEKERLEAQLAACQRELASALATGASAATGRRTGER